MSNHGGKRPGAGRKVNSGKFKELTKPMRIPESCEKIILDWLAVVKEKRNSHTNDTAFILPPLPSVDILPIAAQSQQILSQYTQTVSAGMPLTVNNYPAEPLDLNKHVTTDSKTTFCVRALGDSMINAGIYSGDLLIIDRSLAPINNDIIIAAVDGDLTVKRFLLSKNEILLTAENPDFDDISITPDRQFFILGVVTYVLHGFR